MHIGIVQFGRTQNHGQRQDKGTTGRHRASSADLDHVRIADPHNPSRQAGDAGQTSQEASVGGPGGRSKIVKGVHGRILIVHLLNLDGNDTPTQPNTKGTKEIGHTDQEIAPGNLGSSFFLYWLW